MTDRLIAPDQTPEDEAAASLRPLALDDFVGQQKAGAAIAAAMTEAGEEAGAETLIRLGLKELAW